MAQTMRNSEMERSGGEVHDLVGVGFGPSNLALAIAVAEHNAQEPLAGADGEPVRAHFVERQPRFGWHTGMLIADATMQVSFLKDLVTLRNPASRFSFLSYLHSRGRLVDYINQKTLFPLRTEFHDYFEWCAGQVDDQVTYGHEVAAVRPVFEDGAVAWWDVVARSHQDPDDTIVLRARNVVLATGLEPRMPSGVAPGDRIWHNRDLLHRVAAFGGAGARRFVVVGAGQSAAETTAYLHDHFQHAEVCSVFSRFGYSPSDDTPFANRIFDPSTVDEYYGAPEPTRQQLMEYHSNTNYSAVDMDLIEELYRRSYQEKVLGTRRLRFFGASRLTRAVESNDSVRVTITSSTTGESAQIDADAVVCATGYRPSDSLPLLGDFSDRCHRDHAGRANLERDYRVVTDAGVNAGIYLQGGGTEHTHGITSSLLSNNAIRSGEILRSLLRRRATSPPAPRLAASGVSS